MDFRLTETQQSIRELARNFAQGQIAPRAKAHDREEQLTPGLLRQLADLGLMGINIAPQLGGAGAGVVAYAVAMMEVAAACASTSVVMAVTNMCAELIARFGTEAQRNRYVPKLASGEGVAGAFALSEPHCGSDAAALKTRAERRGGGWLLNGTKQWITSGAYAGVMVVWARVGSGNKEGITAFIVEGGTPGLQVGKAEDKLGLRGSNTVALTFDNCEIPAENLLGREGQGFELAMSALDGGRIGIASQACGVARAALEAAKRYAHERQAFGRRIAELQAIQWFVANMGTDLRAAELLTLRAAALKEAGNPFTKEASMAKLFASEMAYRSCDKAIQVHGGYGYSDEFAVERLFRDARVQTIYEGTSEIQRVVIAREVLKASSV